MNEIVNNFLLTGDTFMPEMHFVQPGFTYNVLGPFTKNKKRIQKFKEIGDSRYIYQIQHNMAYGNVKDLTRRTASGKILRDKAFNVAKNPKYYGYQKGLASMAFKLFDKKTSRDAIKNKNMSNQELAEEIHKSIIGKFENEKYTRLL